jgi:hypothetical protein
MPGRVPSEIIYEHLAVYLGPHTAKTALRTFAQKALGIAPEEVSPAQAPRLLDALRPALKTLLGAGKCQSVVEQMERDLRSLS